MVLQIFKNAILYIRVVSDHLCNGNGPPAQVQNELAPQLSLAETGKFLQAVVYGLCKTLLQLVEVKTVTKK